jgi:hypothetical protein
MEPFLGTPEIAVNEFLPIFISATLVIVFGALYAGAITLSKMGFIPKKWSYTGYIFWILQTWALYDMAVRIKSNPFTIKVLIVTMIAYLFIPHLYFKLVNDIDRKYED